jgi:hypothetical protein
MFSSDISLAEEVDIDEFIDRLNEFKRQYEKKHPPKEEVVHYVEVDFDSVKNAVVDHCKNMTFYEAAFITFLVIAVTYTIYA